MMLALIRQLSANLLNRNSVQVLVWFSLIGIGVFTALSYQNFIYLQSQNISQLSLYNEVIKPLIGLVLVFQILLSCLISASLTPYLGSRGQLGMILHSPLSELKLVAIIYSVILLFGFIPIVYFGLISLFYFSVSAMDIGLIISASMALLSGLLLYGAYITATVITVRKNILAILLAVIGVIVLSAIDELLRSSKSLNSFSMVLDLMFHLRAGLIVPNAVISWLLWCALFFSIAVLLLKTMRLRQTKAQLIIVVSITLVIAAHGFFAPAYSFKAKDISIENLNSLDDNKALLLSAIDPKTKIIINAVIDEVEKHDEIRHAYDIIKQYHPESELIFTSRQALGAKSNFVDQFVTVEMGDLQQSLRFPFDRSAKEALTDLLNQLSTRADQWILFVEGHGEASPFGQSNRDLSLFYASLKELGWPVAMQNFSKQMVISKNTKVLVLAASQQQWLPNEVELLKDYLTQGGNLLLLREQNDRIPEALIQWLGIELLPGTLIDWQGHQSGTPHPAIMIVNDFTQHPINTGIDSLLAFPWASGLTIKSPASHSQFEIQPVIRSHSGVWTEFNSEQQQLSFNPEEGELRQVFDIAIALNNKNQRQRIIVVGDSSFLSDSAINNYDNRQFGLNLISWLSAQNILVSKQGHLDNHIRISPLVHFVLRWGFSLVIPLLLAFWLVVRRVRAYQTKASSN